MGFGFHMIIHFIPLPRIQGRFGKTFSINS